ncbi:MAG: hypothetical protein RJB01_1785 [Actinomycetota bacterium]|jgi:hypothetical protein
MKRLLALLAAIVAVPVAVSGVFEMEGILVFIFLGPLMLITWRLSVRPVPHLAWVSWIVSIALLVITVTAAVVTMHAREGGQEMTWWLAVLLVAYEIAVALAIIGSVWSLVRQIKHFRAEQPNPSASQQLSGQ